MPRRRLPLTGARLKVRQAQDARQQLDAYQGCDDSGEDYCQACGAIVASVVLDTESHRPDCPRLHAELWGQALAAELRGGSTWEPWAVSLARVAGHYGLEALR